MNIGLEIDDADFQRNMAKLSVLTNKTMGEVVEDQARGFLRRVIGMTPPQGRKVKGIAAKKALEGRILTDMHGIFAPVDLKKSRTERHPDLDRLFRAQPMVRRKNRMKRLGRPGDKYYVDRKKFLRLHRKLKKRVGRLAGGWNAAADALAVKRPAWARRHGRSEGSASIRRGGRARISVSNNVPYANEAHLARIADAAVRYQTRALARQLPHVMRRLLRKSRLAA